VNVIQERRVLNELSCEVNRLQTKLDAAMELLDGQFAEDLHRQTGIPLERCRELLEKIRE
jgi:hypothetical protein